MTDTAALGPWLRPTRNNNRLRKARSRDQSESDRLLGHGYTGFGQAVEERRRCNGVPENTVVSEACYAL